VVVTDLAKSWRSTITWTPAVIAAACPDAQVFVRGSRARMRDIGRLTLAQYIEWLEEGRFRPAGASRGTPLLDAFDAADPVKPYVAYDATLPATALRNDIGLDALRLPGFEFRTMRFWIGPEGASTPLHYDSWGYNIFYQAYGRKRFLLFAPEEKANLYPSDVFEFNTVYSRIDTRHPDLARFPRWSKARPLETVLAPGEVLVLPPNWWHDVETLEPSISVNAWLVHARDFWTPTYLHNVARRFLHNAGLYAQHRCTCHLTPDRPDVGTLLGWGETAAQDRP